MATLFRAASSTVARITDGLPACPPHAMLALVARRSNSASTVETPGPSPSPRSALRSTDGMPAPRAAAPPEIDRHTGQRQRVSHPGRGRREPGEIGDEQEGERD